MNELSANKNVFIRPSSNSGDLGGVSNKTKDCILLCEAGDITSFFTIFRCDTYSLKNNHKDYGTQKSLQIMVGKRRNLLEYLKKTDIDRYREIIKKLGIRK